MQETVGGLNVVTVGGLNVGTVGGLNAGDSGWTECRGQWAD